MSTERKGAADTPGNKTLKVPRGKMVKVGDSEIRPKIRQGRLILKIRADKSLPIELVDDPECVDASERPA